mmetsp:Transcript_67413/g.161701  ORF Transcript_67413/g.161701 Transcript_67413/m.161701 type:complete len:308 (+) Transcript_67413:84-1007(+)
MGGIASAASAQNLKAIKVFSGSPSSSGLKIKGPLSKLLEQIRSGDCQRIVVCVGAGISVSAGIPDFRSPGTGLYDNLEKYQLPYPEAIFDLEYFRVQPAAFCALAKELWPGEGLFLPTASHLFLRVLQDRGLLQRVYTQNIDTLEREAGIEDRLLVEAHGSFHDSSCIRCKRQKTLEWTRRQIFAGAVPRCECGGLVKPAIVFFGEDLPSKFQVCLQEDFGSIGALQPDLMIIAGTSLQVAPFAGIPSLASCPRILINREIPENFARGPNDVTILGNCDAGFHRLAALLGWKQPLKHLLKSTSQSQL